MFELRTTELIFRIYFHPPSLVHTSSMPSGRDVVKDRFLWLLVWQSIQSSAVYLIFWLFVIAPFASKNSFSFVLCCIFSFTVFHSSLLILSFFVFLSISAEPYRPPTPLELVSFIFGYLFLSEDQRPSSEFLLRVKISAQLISLVAVSGISGSLVLASLCGKFYWTTASDVAVCLRGLVHGLIYGMYYVFACRWVLEYPIIQRPTFFNFKMGLPRALGKALKLSSFSYVVSGAVILTLPEQLKGQNPVRELVANEIVLFVGGYIATACWELNVKLHQVLHTRRFKFAPPKGSAASETNPSEDLLVALEEAPDGSVLQYLAYLDLCMVCDSNVDSWRRASFFEETGETYRRVITMCLKHLHRFTSKLSDGLESSVDKSNLAFQFTSQIQPELKLRSSGFPSDFQLCVLSARAVASLTARSHLEDRYGVAQLSGSNAKVMSAFLSCLLALEGLMGKKTNLQSSSQLTEPARIKWAACDARRTPVAGSGSGRSDVFRSCPRAYAMADVLRTSVYSIISAFRDDMLNAKSGLIEKAWLVEDGLVYGTHEMLLQKLHLFLNFQAC